MISKELLSEVLGYTVFNPSIDTTNTIVTYLKDDYDGMNCTVMTISIYELSYKCKEWALKQAIYSMASGLNLEHKQINNIIYWSSVQTEQGALCSYYYSNTEPEAIFKACQWILDNEEM